MTNFIRQIGDRILQSKVPAFDWRNIGELPSYLEIMKKRLIETGGVGIAANQCAEIAVPKAVVIVGTYDESLKVAAKQRYPDRQIPDAMVMVNPTILEYKGEAYYPGEGCLSVKGGLRGCVQRYKEVVVSYQDENGKQQQKTFTDFTAHIVQHECDHLDGTVYLQKIINELNAEQLLILRECINTVLKQNNAFDDVTAPTMVFDREGDKVVFNRHTLWQELNKMDKQTLEGVLLSEPKR